MKASKGFIYFGVSALSATSILVGCSDPGYKITGDNKREVSQYQEQRAGAIAYLLKTTVYVGEIRNMTTLPAGTALVAQHNKMSALSSEGDVFGNVLSPLSHCRGAGYKAGEYWSTVAGNIRTQKPDEALKAYVAEAQDCQNQIDNAPAAVTYIETPLGKAPPADGCLKVVSLGEEEKVQEWSCSSALLSGH